MNTFVIGQPRLLRISRRSAMLQVWTRDGWKDTYLHYIPTSKYQPKVCSAQGKR